jgi:hypothetical protein
VGDDVMYLVVGGDFRENVIFALQKTLNEIKSTVTQKTRINRVFFKLGVNKIDTQEFLFHE